MSRQFRSDDTDKWQYGFGDGSDGDLTISSNTTEAPIDASCSGTSGSTSLSATNASFSSGQLVLIHQSRGTGVGNWELNKIASYVAGTITLAHPLQNTYTDSGDSQAQVRVMRQYNNVTINASQTLTAKAWGGDVGGLLDFFAKGTVTINGSISLSGKGYVGKTLGGSGNRHGLQGEGTLGAGSTTTGSNGNAGGGGQGGADQASGGHGGNSSSGSNGTSGSGVSGGTGGAAAGNTELTNAVFGGAGGTGGAKNSGWSASGTGGGFALIIAKDITISGTIVSGATAGSCSGTDAAAGGGGAGGSVLIKCQTATLGTNKITALGAGNTGYKSGGSGSSGRIHLDYKDSYTGTTNPTLSARQDATLDYLGFKPRVAWFI